MPPIAVRPYPLARSFPSFEAAVRHAQSHPDLPRARRAVGRLDGTTLVDAWWTDAECGLRFDRGPGLRVRATPAGMRWRLLTADAVTPPAACRVGSPPVVFDFPNIGRWPMDISALVGKRYGAAVYDLFVGDLGFFVYLRGHPVLCFGSVERVAAGRAVLCVFEEG